MTTATATAVRPSLRFTLVILLTIPVLFATGCPPLEQTARNGIAASLGVLKSENDAHPACGAIVKGTTATGPAVLTNSTCAAINHGADAEVLAIDALEAYCGGPGFDGGSGTGICEPHSGAQAKLKSALANLQQVIGDVQKLK